MSGTLATSLRLLSVLDRVSVYDAWNRQASLDANGDNDLFDNRDWQYEYDGAGRMTRSCATDGGGDAGWSDADDVSGDIVLEQSEVQHDEAGNHVEPEDSEIAPSVV